MSTRFKVVKVGGNLARITETEDDRYLATLTRDDLLELAKLCGELARKMDVDGEQKKGG